MEKALFAEFPPITDEQWQQQVLKDLKGAAPETLEWDSPEGIKVAPYYRKGQPALHVPVRPVGEWLIRQDIEAANSAQANQEALNALQRGATALQFICTTATDVNVLLKDVLIEHIHTDWKIDNTAVLDKLVGVINDRGLDPNTTKGSLNFAATDAVAHYNQYHKLLPGFQLFTIEASNAATLAEQTAAQLAQANSLASTLIAAGVSATDALNSIRFEIGVGTNYFFEIARVRVLRALWMVVCQQYDTGYTTPATIHATNNKVLPEKDGYYEMIRQTTQALSAVIGGVDSLSIVPHIVTPDKSEGFQTRIARNVQLILQHESHLDTVTDPAAGAWYIESITSEMAFKAWELFVKSTQTS